VYIICDCLFQEKKYLELQAALVQQALDSEREVFKVSSSLSCCAAPAWKVLGYP
jgi:hypothetical protein